MVGARVPARRVLVVEDDREVLGIEVADGEMVDAWRRFPSHLIDRGLRGVQLVISDAHAGLTKALRIFNGASWQRCRVHFMRNVLSRVKRTAQGFVSATVRHIFAQATYDEAQTKLEEAIDRLTPKSPAAADVLRDGGLDAITYLSFPEKHRRQIHSTNPLERLNHEIKRRVNVVGIFPNNASALHLITMIVADQHNEWAVGRRYFRLEPMAALAPKTEPIGELEEVA